nr:hypothetical protein GCM10010200_096290 [Actinomadura rugatobispora]
MKARALGRTGIQVSPYCLGTMMFGRFGNPDPDDCVRIVHRALEAGINFVDTADVYGPAGVSEEIVGRALQGRRDDVVLATKVGGSMGEDPNRSGGSRRWIVTAVENSLRRLRTDRIDLYQIHHPDPQTDIEETLSALTDLVRSGKVRAIGASNTRPRRSSRRSGRPSGAAWSASAPSSPHTPSSTAASSARSCPPAGATAWARWCGVRCPWACSPAATARAGPNHGPNGCTGCPGT